jgi:hypothetical protein
MVSKESKFDPLSYHFTSLDVSPLKITSRLSSATFGTNCICPYFAVPYVENPAAELFAHTPRDIFYVTMLGIRTYVL